MSGAARAVIRGTALLLPALLWAACFVPREPQGRADQRCTQCHGDPARPGEALARAAPPTDVLGNTSVLFPGVGAHARHLDGTASAAPVACAACHPVPLNADDEGHNDGRTQVALGGAGRWDLGSRTCSSSTCHGPVSGVWTRPRENACGTCHGLPPPSPHPQAGRCAACHAEVLGPDEAIAAPALHVDGTVQVTTARCDACHGSDERGAPPRGLDGGTASSQRGVGAHQTHLAGGLTSRPVPCATCHPVPATPTTAEHPDGVLQATAFSAASATCRTACHLGVSPPWTSSAPLSCSGCHGAPPPAPHPAVAQCGLCHPPVDASARNRHVDGTLDLAVPATCTGCHGSGNNPAPPLDLSGSSDSARPGVGAHVAHLVSRGFARVVQCDECHVVPATVSQPGHLDGTTQLRFAGVVRTNGATPRYAGGTCAGTACHDLAHFTGAPAGGTDTAPVWTRVDGSQRTCGSCHGMPPPPPHVARGDCESCHLNVTAQRTFLQPERHVDGRVDFQ